MMIISVQTLGPGVKDSRMGRALMAAMRSASELRKPKYEGTLGRKPHVNVVFFVEGAFGAPDFDDMRLGPYSRKNMCIRVDAAVSAEQANAENLRDFIVLSLHKANAEAFYSFENKGVEFPLREAEELAKKVGEELSEFSGPVIN